MTLGGLVWNSHQGAPRGACCVASLKQMHRKTFPTVVWPSAQTNAHKLPPIVSRPGSLNLCATWTRRALVTSERRARHANGGHLGVLASRVLSKVSQSAQRWLCRLSLTRKSEKISLIRYIFFVQFWAVLPVHVSASLLARLCVHLSVFVRTPIFAAWPKKARTHTRKQKHTGLNEPGNSIPFCSRFKI